MKGRPLAALGTALCIVLSAVVLTIVVSLLGG